MTTCQDKKICERGLGSEVTWLESIMILYCFMCWSYIRFRSLRDNKLPFELCSSIFFIIISLFQHPSWIKIMTWIILDKHYIFVWGGPGFPWNKPNSCFLTNLLSFQNRKSTQERSRLFLFHVQITRSVMYPC